MGTEPITDYGLAMSQDSSEARSDNAGPERPTTTGAAFAPQSACGPDWAVTDNAVFAGERNVDRAAIDQDGDVTVVVAKGFPRLCYSQRQLLRSALTIVGIAAIGLAATGIVKLAVVRHRASSQIQRFPIAAPPVPFTNKPATDLPSPSVPVSPALAQASKLGAPGPTSVASRAENPMLDAVAAPQLGNGRAGEGKADLSMCRAALTKRDTSAITHACGPALEVDASLAAPILAWAKRELDRGNVSVAAIWARRVLDTDDRLADAYLIVGVAEQEARHASTAKAAYRRYLELAPKGQYVRDVRSSIAAL